MKRRELLKGAAAATAATALPVTTKADGYDTSDIAFMEATLAEIGRLEHRWLKVNRAADMAGKDESPEARAIEKRSWALGDKLAAHPITSPQGALFKAEAICSGVGPMFRDAWPMMPQHVEAMQVTLKDWLAQQAASPATVIPAAPQTANGYGDTSDDAELFAVIKRYRSAQAQSRAADTACRVASGRAYFQAWDAAIERATEALNRALDTRAKSPAGMLAKMTLANGHNNHELTSLVFDCIQRDLEALPGEVPS